MLARVERKGVVRRLPPSRGNGNPSGSPGAERDGARPGAGASGGDGRSWSGQIIGRVVGVYRRVAKLDPAD